MVIFPLELCLEHGRQEVFRPPGLESTAHSSIPDSSLYLCCKSDRIPGQAPQNLLTFFTLLLGQHFLMSLDKEYLRPKKLHKESQL